MMTTRKLTLLSLLVLLPYYFCGVPTAVLGNEEEAADSGDCSAGGHEDGGTSSRCANKEEEDGLALLHLRSKLTKKKSDQQLAPHRASLFQMQSKVHQAAEEARGKKVLALVQTFHAAKQRKGWAKKNNALRKKSTHDADEFGKFLEQIKNSGDECSAKLLQSAKNLHALHDHVVAFATQVSSQEEILATERATLSAAEAAIAGARSVRDDTIAQCEADQQKAAEDAARMLAELKELREIADPAVRANMVGHDVEAEAAEVADAGAADAADEAGADEDAAPDAEVPALLQTGSSKNSMKKSRKKQRSSFSQAQCLAFLQWAKKSSSASSSKKGVKTSSSWPKRRLSVLERFASMRKTKLGAKALQEPANDAAANNAAANNAAAPANNAAANNAATNNAAANNAAADTDEVDCATALGSIQEQFDNAYHSLEKVHDDKLRDSKDTTCVDKAHTEFNLINVPESERREKSTDKILEVNGALNELRAVVSILHQQDADLEAHVVLLRSECADTAGLSVYMTGVRNLIQSAAECPGVKETTLKMPHDRCKTDGSGTCSWECGSKGQVFATGGYYGEIPGFYGPLEGEVNAKVTCETTCIADKHCVGFTLHDFGEAYSESGSVMTYDCFHKLDVLGGRFVDQDPVEASEFPVEACFIKERQDIVNAHRDPDHPGITDDDIVDYWWEVNDMSPGSEDVVATLKKVFANVEDMSKLPDEITSLFDAETAEQLPSLSNGPDGIFGQSALTCHEDDEHCDKCKEVEGGDPDKDADAVAKEAGAEATSDVPDTPATEEAGTEAAAENAAEEPAAEEATNAAADNTPAE